MRQVSPLTGAPLSVNTTLVIQASGALGADAGLVPTTLTSPFAVVPLTENLMEKVRPVPISMTSLLLSPLVAQPSFFIAVLIFPAMKDSDSGSLPTSL